MEMKLPPDLASNLSQKGIRDLVMGIRPEHVSFSATQKEAVATFKVRVVSVEKFSQFKILSFRVGRKLFTGRSRAAISEGSEGFVHFQPDRLRFFDAETEKSFFL